MVKIVKRVRVSDSIGQENALASSGKNRKECVNENSDVLRRSWAWAPVKGDKAAKCLDSLEHGVHCPCSKLHREN